MRVLIVDDQEFIRRGIRAVLSDAEDIEVCGEAVDGHEAIQKTRQLRPDVVVMDISMPRLDGIEATREIRHTFPSVRVLTLSQYELPDVMKEALEAGAATHVSKIYVWTQLVPALRRVQLGHTFFDGNFAGIAESNLKLLRRGRAELERELRDSEERFRSTFDLTPSGIGHVDEEGRWLRVNQRLCEIAGYSKDEFEKLKFQDITHPAELAAELAEMGRILAGENDRFSQDRRLIRKDGEVATVQLLVQAVRGEDGKVKYCIRVVEDNRQRNEAEAQLAQAKQELHLATAHLEFVSHRLSLALNRCSRDFRYLWANQNFANWLDRPLENIIGRSISDVLGNEAFQKLRPRFDQVLAGESVEHQDTVNFRGLGERSVSAAYMPTFDPSGIADGWIAMVHDMTAEKRPKQTAIGA